MTDEEGLLSQDEINAALTEAGLDPASMMGGSNVESEPPAQPPDSRVDAAGRPFDEVAAAMAEAIEQEKLAASGSAEQAAPGGDPLPAGAAAFAIPELAGKLGANVLVEGIDLLRDVELNVKIELGRSRMLVDDVLRLGEGSVVELDKLAGDPVDVFVNERLVARGEVLVLNDNFCVRINDVVKQEGDEES
jgi:flagellar motor switch protein FliN